MKKISNSFSTNNILLGDNKNNKYLNIKDNTLEIYKHLNKNKIKESLAHASEKYKLKISDQKQYSQQFGDKELIAQKYQNQSVNLDKIQQQQTIYQHQTYDMNNSYNQKNEKSKSFSLSSKDYLQKILQGGNKIPNLLDEKQMNKTVKKIYCNENNEDNLDNIGKIKEKVRKLQNSLQSITYKKSGQFLNQNQQNYLSRISKSISSNQNEMSCTLSKNKNQQSIFKNQSYSLPQVNLTKMEGDMKSNSSINTEKLYQSLSDKYNLNQEKNKQNHVHLMEMIHKINNNPLINLNTIHDNQNLLNEINETDQQLECLFNNKNIKSLNSKLLNQQFIQEDDEGHQNIIAANRDFQMKKLPDILNVPKKNKKNMLVNIMIKDYQKDIKINNKKNIGQASSQINLTNKNLNGLEYKSKNKQNYNKWYIPAQHRLKTKAQQQKIDYKSDDNYLYNNLRKLHSMKEVNPFNNEQIQIFKQQEQKIQGKINNIRVQVMDNEGLWEIKEQYEKQGLRVPIFLKEILNKDLEQRRKMGKI